jgi:hypothetical protein
MASYRVTTARAALSYAGDNLVFQRTDLCLVPERPEINISLWNGATEALIRSVDTGWSASFGNGTYTLPSPGWYSVGFNYVLGGRLLLPSVTVSYDERYRDDQVALGGVPFADLHLVGDRVSRPHVDIGVCRGRLLLEAGVDDDLYVNVDGNEIFHLGYGQDAIFELTQRVPYGPHNLEIVGYDDNDGKCWALGFRIGDAQTWKHSEHYANTACPSPLPLRRRRTYDIRLSLVMQGPPARV